jgi:hypothetical protein
VSQGAAHIDDIGGNPLKWRQRAQAFRGGHEYNDALKILDSDEFRPVKGDDDFGKAVLNGGGTIDGFKRVLRETGKFTNDEIDQKASHYEILRSKHGDVALEQAAFLSSDTASTFLSPGDQGRAEALDYISRISRGDNQTMAQLVGKHKEIAPAAGRGDTVAPFSDFYTAARSVSNATTPEARRQALQEAGAHLGDILQYTEGPEYALSGKGRVTEGSIAPIQRQIQRAMSNHDTAFKNGSVEVTRPDGSRVVLTEPQARQEMVEVLAQTSATADLLGRVSPEKQRLFNEGLLNQQIPGLPDTVRQTIDSISDTPEFQSTLSRYEREMAERYNRGTQDEAEMRRRMAEEQRNSLGGGPGVGMPPPSFGG